MKYLGCLDRSDFEKLKPIEQDLFLKKEGYFEDQKIVILDEGKSHFLNKIEIPTIIKFSPNSDLNNVFYDFLLETYDELIFKIYHNLMVDLNDDIYGLSHKKQKKIALKEFNQAYDLFDMYNFHGIDLETSDTNIHINQVERFAMLYLNRMQRLNSIATREFILEYLYGNIEFFNEELYYENDLIVEFVGLEANLMFMINLNNIYEFEVDRFFSGSARMTEIYKKYDYIFKSEKIFQRTYETINSFQDKIPSSIVSLYEVLTKLNLINDNKEDFKKYLKSIHNRNMKNIPKYDDYDAPKPHIKRVSKMIESFQDLTSEI